MMTLAYLRRNGVRLHTAYKVTSEAEVEIVRGECHTQAMSIKRMCGVEWGSHSGLDPVDHLFLTPRHFPTYLPTPPISAQSHRAIIKPL
jgi:hypothetical protein